MKWTKRGDSWFLSRKGGVEVLAMIEATPHLALPFHGTDPDGRQLGGWTLKDLKAQIEKAVRA